MLYTEHSTYLSFAKGINVFHASKATFIIRDKNVMMRSHEHLPPFILFSLSLSFQLQ